MWSGTKIISSTPPIRCVYIWKYQSFSEKPKVAFLFHLTTTLPTNHQHHGRIEIKSSWYRLIAFLIVVIKYQVRKNLRKGFFWPIIGMHLAPHTPFWQESQGEMNVGTQLNLSFLPFLFSLDSRWWYHIQGKTSFLNQTSGNNLMSMVNGLCPGWFQIQWCGWWQRNISMWCW